MGAITALEDFADDCGLELEPFQRRILRAIASGTREVVVLLPRGNGKTALAALVALHHLVTVAGRQGRRGGRQPRSRRRTCSTTRARYAYALGDPHVVHRHLRLRWCPQPAREKVWTRSLEVWAVGRAQAARPDLLAGDRRRAAGARVTTPCTSRWPPRCTSAPARSS